MFFSFLEMSISGAIMIIAVIVIRSLTINRLFKKTFLALWGIVLLRLTVPFSFPSAFSVYSIIVKAVPLFKRFDNGQVVNNLPISSDIPSAITPTVPPINTVPFDNQLSEQIAVGVSPYLIAWIIGFTLCGLFFVVSYFKCRLEFRESLPVNNDFLAKWKAENRIKRNIDIRQSSHISAPLTYGIFKPVILLPKEIDWDNTQFTYILAHELVHIKRFDVAIKLILTIVVCVHWFNPLVWVMYILSNRDIELSCDETVVCSFGNTTKSVYAMTLISMEEQKSRLFPFVNSFSKNAFEERITAIMKMKKISMVSMVLAVILVVTTGTVFATSPKAILSNEVNKDKTTINGQTIVYDSVQLKYYDDGSPYLHDNLTNNTDKTITNIVRCMLAYDKLGNPLKVQWNPLNSYEKSAYEYLFDDEVNIPAGKTDKTPGGWSLDDEGNNKVAYSLYNLKQVTFADGTVWDNPDFENWFEAYKGNKIEVKKLQSYYPYTMKVGPTVKGELSDMGEYTKWGITEKDGVKYYKDARIRILMDQRANKSFKKLAFATNGIVDVRLVRDENDIITKVEYIPKDEATEILKDIEFTKETSSEKETSDKKSTQDIKRMKKENVPSDVLKLINNSVSGKWHIFESQGRQYIYYDSVPHNYAFQYEQDKNKLHIVDIGTSAEQYVLLSVAKNDKLSVEYNSNKVSLLTGKGAGEMWSISLKGSEYFYVDNEEQLRLIGTEKYPLSNNYALNRDITLTKEWKAIGDEEHPFTGSFNGNGYEIIGLKNTDPNAVYIGLFGYAEGANIYNVTLRNVDIDRAGGNGKHVGAIVAIAIDSKVYDNEVIK